MSIIGCDIYPNAVSFYYLLSISEYSNLENLEIQILVILIICGKHTQRCPWNTLDNRNFFLFSFLSHFGGLIQIVWIFMYWWQEGLPFAGFKNSCCLNRFALFGIWLHSISISGRHVCFDGGTLIISIPWHSNFLIFSFYVLTWFISFV